MNTVKLIPSAIVNVDVLDLNGNLTYSVTTRNALKASFIEDVAKGLFSNRFTLRLGFSNAPSDFYDVMLMQQAAISNADPWPIALESSAWPIATVTDGVIEWSTTQIFEVPSDLLVGNVYELGLDFQGKIQGDIIHARAVLPSPIALDGNNQLRISYKLIFKAAFADSTYTVSSVYNGNTTQHTVLQRWNKACTLWDIIGGTPPANECHLYLGDLNPYNVTPTEPVGESYQAYAAVPGPTSFGVTAVIDASVGNSLYGLKVLTWKTIPVKMSFDPALPKSSENVMSLSLFWELSV